jgi:hypothetical protein
MNDNAAASAPPAGGVSLVPDLARQAAADIRTAGEGLLVPTQLERGRAYHDPHDESGVFPGAGFGAVVSDAIDAINRIVQRGHKTTVNAATMMVDAIAGFEELDRGNSQQTYDLLNQAQGEANREAPKA